jgi:hypothetical protein
VARRTFGPLALLSLAGACTGGAGTTPADALVADAPIPVAPDAAAPEDVLPVEAPPPDPVLPTMLLRPPGERTLQHMECGGNAAGDGMVIWRESDPSGKHEVWAARLGRDGQWQPAESLGARPTTELDRLGVTVDAEGQALAVWNELDGPQAGVVSARSLPATGWEAPARISAGWVLSLVGSATGEAVAFGVVDGTPPTLLRYRPGAGWTLDSSLRQERSGFFFAGAGGRAVLLSNQPVGPGTQDLVASEYASGTWSTPLRVQEALPFDHPLPSVNATIALDGSGLAVWNRGGDLQGELWAATTSAPGTWEAPRRLSQGSAPLWTTTAVVRGAGAMVSWETGMPPRRKVWAARRAGGAWQESVMLAEGAEADTAALAASGEALVAWSTARRVYGRHHTPARGWGPAQLALGDNGGVSDLCAFIDGQGRGWILWINGGPQKLRAAPIHE